MILRAVLALVISILSVFLMSASAQEVKLAAAKKADLPFCDEIKSDAEMAKDENGQHVCQAKNAHKEIKYHHPVPSSKKQELTLQAYVTDAEDVSKIDRIEKKEVTLDAYERWSRIQTPLLSPDGRWAAYTLTSGRGSADLVLRATQDSMELRIPLGRVTRRSSVLSPARDPVSITADSRFAIFTIVPEDNETVEERRLMSFALGIVNLQSHRITKIGSISSFKLPSRSGRHIAYKTEANALVIQDLSSWKVIRIPDVSEFVFDNYGRHVLYTVSSAEDELNGVYLHRLEDGQITPLLTGPGDYRSVTFDMSGKQVAFLSGKGGQVGGNDYSIYHARLSAAAKPVVTSASLTQGMCISREGGVKFMGDTLAFQVMQARRTAVPVAGQGESAVLELWHWRDPVIQPQQKALVRLGIQQTYLAVHHIGPNRTVQLGSEEVPQIMLTDDALHAVGIDQNPYMIEETWGDIVADIYRIDTMSGERRLLRRAFRAGEWFSREPMKLSPSGKYLLYFENQRWFSYDFERDRTMDLTGTLLPETQFDSEYVSIRVPRPVGIAGWTADDRQVLIYSRRDVWEIDPTGNSAPRSLTKMIGSKENIIFRLWPDSHHSPNFHSDTGNAFLDTSQSLLLTAYDVDTGKTGFWRNHAGTNGKLEGKLEPFIMLDKQLTLLAKSAESQQYLLTQETFQEFPDLWAGKNLSALKKISNANPQQHEYRWGTAELVEWTSSFGAPLKGVLYKPDDFNEKEKYPMVVHVYGWFSDSLHSYYVPEIASSAWVSSPTSFLSKGYLVFMPDIPIFLTPYYDYSQNALASVVPGVQSIIDRGFVDASRIALFGHSWGARQVANIVARTKLFSCAVASAGTWNAISEYGGVSPGSGIPNSQQIDARFGSLWDHPLVYWENSPVLFADRIETPLLIMHNEDDPGISFAQAVEIYIALRRNRKEVYMANYSKEGHELRRHVNKVDWHKRMHQFVDHFLGEQPSPQWMVRGLPYSRKEN